MGLKCPVSLGHLSAWLPAFPSSPATPAGTTRQAQGQERPGPCPFLKALSGGSTNEFIIWMKLQTATRLPPSPFCPSKLSWNPATPPHCALDQGR